jgi:hypothetical protein
MLPESYKSAAPPIVDEQLGKACVRLAMVLNPALR